MPVVTYRPFADNPAAQTFLWTGGTANWDVTDDDPDTPNDSDYSRDTIVGSGNGLYICGTSNLPNDFSSIATDTGRRPKVKVRFSVTGWVNDTLYVTVILRNSNGANNITQGATMATGNQAITTVEYTLTPDSPYVSRSWWNNFTMCVVVDQTASMGADSTVVTVYAIEALIDYNVDRISPIMAPRLSS